jgi:glutaredoxin
LVSRSHRLLERANIPYEIKNVTSNPAYAEELKVASGQCISPSLDVDGTMLADASVEDVAKVFEKRGLII